jgi:1,4-dihydroxy-2-naphthoate octaprenyltransferase
VHISTMPERSKHRMVVFILVTAVAASAILFLIVLGESNLVVISMGGLSLTLAVLILLLSRRN